MSPQRIKAVLNKEPFEPFTVVKGDGEEVDIISREMTFLHPGGRTLYVVAPKFKGAKDEEDFEDHQIDVFLVTDIVQPLRRRSGRNGKKH
jgi:hypothetical protein